MPKYTIRDLGELLLKKIDLFDNFPQIRLEIEEEIFGIYNVSLNDYGDPMNVGESSLYTEYGLIEDGKLKDYLYKKLKKKQIILLKSICNKNNLYIKAVLHPLGWHDWIFQIHLNETPFLVSDNQIVLEFKIRSKMFFNNFKFECSLIPNETFYENTFSFSVDDFDIDKIFKRYQEL